MPDSRPGAHRLNVSGAGQAHTPNAVAMSHRPPADVTNDLHVDVAVKIKAAPGSDFVVVPNNKRTHRRVFGVALRSHFEMMPGLQPTVVSVIESLGWSNPQHDECLHLRVGPIAAPGDIYGVCEAARLGAETRTDRSTG